MAELVSKAYAEALFEVGLEMDKLDALKEEFGYVVEQFAAFPELLNLYKSPQIQNTEKKDIVKSIFSTSISAELMNLLNILIDKSRTEYAERIFAAYVEFLEHHKKESTAFVKSVVPLTELQEKNLIDKLQLMTGKKIFINSVIDPLLIGGVMVKIGDQVMDGSLKLKISEMKDSLTQIVI